MNNRQDWISKQNNAKCIKTLMKREKIDLFCFDHNRLEVIKSPSETIRRSDYMKIYVTGNYTNGFYLLDNKY